MKRFRTSLVSLVMACALLRAVPLHGQSNEVDEDKALKVKAAYLLNFTKFVTWPADVFEDAHSPIVIGIVGIDPFGSILDRTIKDKTVAGRPLTVRRIQWRAGESTSALKQCHLLYVSPSLGDGVAALIDAVAHMPILTIGEGEEFAKIGGILGFVAEGGRIVFWANRKAAEAAKLQLNSQLLKLARPIEDVAVAKD
ncbi:MAG: YfiR family protein [Planctomycetes bacterium]|nr:YfiR family protein [Planctomycetota bacterium]